MQEIMRALRKPVALEIMQESVVDLIGTVVEKAEAEHLGTTTIVAVVVDMREIHTVEEVVEAGKTEAVEEVLEVEISEVAEITSQKNLGRKSLEVEEGLEEDTEEVEAKTRMRAGINLIFKKTFKTKSKDSNRSAKSRRRRQLYLSLPQMTISTSNSKDSGIIKLCKC